MEKENEQQRERKQVGGKTTEMTEAQVEEAEKNKLNCMYCSSGKGIEDWQVTGEEKQKLLKSQSNQQTNR